jgi:hypothetical protein
MAVLEIKKWNYSCGLPCFWTNRLQMRSSVEVSVLVGYDATSPDQGSKGLTRP